MIISTTQGEVTESMDFQSLSVAESAAFRAGYQITKDYIGGVVYDRNEGCYIIRHNPDGKPTLNIVETVLLGHVCPTGNWLQDAAYALGVTQEYLRGFIAGLQYNV